MAVVHGHPLLARFGMDEAIVLRTNTLVVKADGEAIVEAALVDKRLVLHFALLCHGRGADATQPAYKEKYFVQQLHRFNYVGFLFVVGESFSTFFYNGIVRCLLLAAKYFFFRASDVELPLRPSSKPLVQPSLYPLA